MEKLLMATESNTGLDIGSIVGWTFAIVGLVATLVGWYVRGQQQRWLAKKKDVHDAIDRAIKSLVDFEDCALSFWIDKDTKHSQHHVLALHRRLVVAFKQVSELSEKDLPVQYISDLRKHSTLDFEQAKRPISPTSPRVSNIALASGRLLNSSYLLKSWKKISEASKPR